MMNGEMTFERAERAVLDYFISGGYSSEYAQSLVSALTHHSAALEQVVYRLRQVVEELLGENWDDPSTVHTYQKLNHILKQYDDSENAK